MRRRLIVSLLAVLFTAGVAVAGNATAAGAETSSLKYSANIWCC
jgi:hypothetical protein